MNFISTPDGMMCVKCRSIAVGEGGIYSCPECRRQQPGLGDMATKVFSAVGITEARAQAVAKAVGLTDCGCGRRRAAMNRLGERLGLPPGSTASTENR